MQLIWDLLNSSLGIAILSATILEYIRQRFQRAAKENAQKMEWLKQTQTKQTELFNELSNLTSNIIGNSQMLFKELIDNMKSPDQTKLDELKEREKALINGILKWEHTYLSIHNQLQQLTQSQSTSDSTAVKLFLRDFRTEISEALTEKITEETSLASAISILCNKTLNYLTLFREIMPLKNEDALTQDYSAQSPVSFGLSANIAMGTALPNEAQKPEPPEIAKLSEYEKEERLSSCWNKITRLLLSKDDMIKWLLDNQQGSALCDTTSKYLLEQADQKNYLVLLRLEMQKDMLEITEQVENKINRFFNALNQDFQKHLDTVDKHIIK